MKNSVKINGVAINVSLALGKPTRSVILDMDASNPLSYQALPGGRDSRYDTC
jgi:hypothetical protein